MGHEWEVYNVQFSSDETSVYSMGMDGKFSQWSVMKSGEKVGHKALETYLGGGGT